MAKKQDISYSPNTSLIGGAAVAYRDYDNMPGMYAGLDKVIKAGSEMIGGAVKDFEEEKKKQEAIEKAWDDSADQVILNAGSLGDTLYNFTSDEVGGDLKKLYLEGVNEKDPKKRREAMRQLQAHSTWVQDHKQMNLDYANAKREGRLSNWYKSKQGSEEAYIIDQIMGQKYTKTSRNEDGDIIFHIPADAKNGYPAREVPSKEYNNMLMPKNYTITANTEKLQASVNKLEIFDEDTAMQSIQNSLPNNEREFLATIHDDVSGKNLITMLNTSETLDREILGAIDPSAWDADSDGVLDPTEKANFIDAATNPDNEFFNLENSKMIMADQIFNGVRNRHIKHWQRKNNKGRKVYTPPSPSDPPQEDFPETPIDDFRFYEQKPIDKVPVSDFIAKANEVVKSKANTTKATENKDEEFVPMKAINIDGNQVDIAPDTYTIVNGKQVTKKEFGEMLKSKSISQEEIKAAGKIITKIQNVR